MGVEEQREEREVLDSIFPEEITDISDTAYRIAIALEVTNEHGDQTEPPTIILNVSYPDIYPDVAPHLDLSSPPNAPKHPLLDVSEDKVHLLKSLNITVEENLGMAMIFTLVTTLKESAEQLIIERQGVVQAQKDKEASKVEEEENRKFHGTSVTKERFLQWREKFRAEIAQKERREKEEREAEEKKKRGGKVEEKKMTGRQLWEGGLAGKGDEEEEVDEDALDGIEKLKVSA
jgi:RWD domain